MNRSQKIRELKNTARLAGFGAGLLLTCILMLAHLLPIPFGYYGKLNIVRSRITALPNVEIIDERLNRDLSLEDFSIDLVIDDTRQSSIYFHDADKRSIPSLLAQVDQVGRTFWGWPAQVGWLVQSSIALLACIGVGWSVSRITRRALQSRTNPTFRFCLHCHYDLTAADHDRCPECGAVVE